MSIRANDDPVAIGSALPSSRSDTDVILGFPVCHARVSYAAEGYAAVFGWSQMVRSTDQSGTFEMDPIATYADLETPFAWYGVKPDAFDAPTRDSLDDLEWEAHCFLCASPDAALTRHAQAVCGFSWGFTIESTEIRIAEAEPLPSSAWDAHLGLLRASYPSWSFDPGYLGG